MMKKTETSSEVTIQEISMTALTFFILGVTPLVPHAVSAKAKGMLLFPSPRKNTAEKATTMKHEPYEEFVDAFYRFTDADKSKTRLYVPASAFHSAMQDAAIDMVGVKKAQIGRLTKVLGGKIPVWGVPEIWTTVVRSSDMNRTPDVRTLPILPRWACRVQVEFVDSLIKQQSVMNLLGASGKIIGVGDGRVQKGKLDMGQFRVVSENDPDLVSVMKTGGIAAQDKAISDPRPYDLETEKLLEWFDAERGRRAAAPAKKYSPKRGGNGSVSRHDETQAT